MTTKTSATMMTMVDAGWVQLEEQEKWFASHDCAVPTDDHADELIGKALDLERINPRDYGQEFSEESFRRAVQAGMDDWYKQRKGSKQEEEESRNDNN